MVVDKLSIPKHFTALIFWGCRGIPNIILLSYLQLQVLYVAEAPEGFTKDRWLDTVRKISGSHKIRITHMRKIHKSLINRCVCPCEGRDPLYQRWLWLVTQTLKTLTLESLKEMNSNGTQNSKKRLQESRQRTKAFSNKFSQKSPSNWHLLVSKTKSETILSCRVSSHQFDQSTCANLLLLPFSVDRTAGQPINW